MPLKWKISIGVFLMIAVFLVGFGLFKDFNKTPSPHVELDEGEEELANLKQLNIPDEILSGNPPKPNE